MDKAPWKKVVKDLIEIGKNDSKEMWKKDFKETDKMDARNEKSLW